MEKIDSKATQSGMTVTHIVSELIEYAFSNNSSDIHIDPTPDTTLVRIRIDGILRTIRNLPREIHPEIISRLKVLSGLRTDEHALPQDGKFKHICSLGEIEVRLSVAPTYHGENAVLRILASYKNGPLLDSLGFSEHDKTILQRSVSRSSGLILTTGPTGSGKTTTLYALLEYINTPEKSIITIEDPVEFALPGIRQMQVNYRTGFTYAAGLRSMLRQDPNIIMVGEIRDKDTSQIAIRTALTGHLVLSSLHTNDAVSTLFRLMDMGADPYLIASTVSLIVSQRLVRKICEHCKEGREVTSENIGLFQMVFGTTPPSLFIGKGCEKCQGTGYKGRIVIAEVLQIKEEFRQAITDRMSHQKLVALAQKTGMKPLRKDAEEKISNGDTTPEEIIRVLYE